MTSSGNFYSPLVTPHPSDVLHNHSNGEGPSPLATIVLIPNSTLSMLCAPSSTTIDENEHDPLVNTKPKSKKQFLMANISRRLLRRKAINSRLCRITDVMCFVGIAGIILMIIVNEISFMNNDESSIYLCWFIKLIITITTAILVSLVFYYHQLDLSLYAVNNSLDTWRVGLTGTKLVLALVEAVICMIHPIPLEFPFTTNFTTTNSTLSDYVSPAYITTDVALGLPMFARLYLLGRLLMFHSHLLRDAFSQSLGSFNQVSVNFYFLLKTYLQLWPARCLLLFCSLIFLISSWSLRACNYKSAMEHVSMIDSMWLFIVTYTTVGYGDLTPSTYCGRGVAAITALIGVLSTALLISVLARKLELTRSEKYVHNFVINITLAKELKNQAANVIKFSLKLWIMRRKQRLRSTEYIQVQRRLFRSIHFNQQLKQEQKHLVDSCVGLPELIAMQQQTSTATRENTDTLTMIKAKVDTIEEKLVNMDQTMMNIQETLRLLLNNRSHQN